MKSLKIVLFALLAGILIYLSYSTFIQIVKPENIKIANKAEGFSGYNLHIPSSEIDAAFRVANIKIETLNSDFHLWKTAGAICAWISFIIGGIITLMASLSGKTSNNSAQNIEFLRKTLTEKGRNTVFIALLAGIGTIASGATVKAKEASDDKRQSAIKLRENIIAAYKDIQGAKSDNDARTVIEKLKENTEEQ